jgi:hypothetical protein
MRADRRHELKENDLSHALRVAHDYFKQHSKGVGLTAGAVIALLVVTTFVVRSRDVETEDRWRQRSLLSYEPDVARQSLESLMALASQSRDKHFVLSTLIEQGAQALRLAAVAENAPDAEYNALARDAFEKLLERFKDNPLALGVAHRGLATVAENDFVLDGDLAHKEEARGHLTAIMDEPALHTTPFYRMARDRREALDKVFTQVVFAPLKPPDEVFEEFPDETSGQVPFEPVPGTPIDITDRLIPVDPPEWAKDLPPLVPPSGQTEPGEEEQEEPVSTDESPEASEAAPVDEQPSESPPGGSGTPDSGPDETP